MTGVVRKRNYLNVSEIESISTARALFQRLCAGETVVVVTDQCTDPEIIFGNYGKVFNIYVKRGVLIIKTVAEMTEDDEGTNWIAMSGY